MLKRLFGKSRGASKDTPHTAHGPEKIDPGRIRTLIEFFPIGKKLRYYPEFNKEIVLDTLVVAYCANGVRRAAPWRRWPPGPRSRTIRPSAPTM